ncbi:MAG TPA: caspase family protein [Flavobacteriales bacterium]|nr:caspase family protein [Flavobacteriales bacterium]
MRTIAFTLSLLMSTLTLAQSSGLRIEITAPRPDGQMILTVNSSPLRVAGKVHSPAKVTLLMIAGEKAEVKDDGTFAHDVNLDEGINRVMLMAADANNARGFAEFHVALDVKAAIAVTRPEPRRDQMQAEPKEPLRETEPKEPVVQPKEPKPQPSEPIAAPPASGGGRAVIDEQRGEPERPVVSKPAHGTLTRDEIMRGNSGTSAGPGRNQVNESEVFALVVGVSRYRYARTQDLRYADSDAAAVAALLREGKCQGIKPDNVVLLQNTMARSEVIKAQLDALLARADENDQFIFYFSGHGMHDRRGQLCLLGADAEIDDPYKAWSSSLTQADLLSALNAAPCRNKVMILDACRSGRATVPENGGDRSANGEVSILTAAGASESSYESDDLQGGIFTHYLLKGWRGKADADGDGTITMQELANYTATETPREAQRTNHEQHPRYAPGAQSGVRMCVAASPMAPERRPNPAQGQVPAQVNIVDEEQPGKEEQRYDSYVEGETKKTLVNVLFTNTQTGDRIRFFNVGRDHIGISALIDGEIFATHSHFRGGDLITFVDNERTNRIGDGRMHLSANWDQVQVEFKLADGRQVRSRALFRTGTPVLKTVGEGRVYGNEALAQQLEVYDEKGEWVMLSGHLGQNLVQLFGHRRGDVLLLTDREAEWSAKGAAFLLGNGSRLVGSLQFEKDKGVEKFELDTLPRVKARRYEGARFDHPTNDQYLSFYDERGGWVHFSGLVHGKSVQGRAQVHADLLDFHPDSGQQFMRGRMLLHEHGDRLMTRFVFAKDEEEGKRVVPLHLFRTK